MAARIIALIAALFAVQASGYVTVQVKPASCPGTEKVSSVSNQGDLVCTEDVAGEGGGGPATDLACTACVGPTELTEAYSLTSHNHNGTYSLTSHDHAGTYSAIDHNHSGTYAPASHTHDYAATSHTHAGGDVTSAVANATSASTAAALAADPSDCTSGQYATTIAASGNLTCAQVAYGQLSGTPTIPADISAAPFVTTATSALLSNEQVLPTCGGTDKLTFNGTTISCAADQTGAGGGVTKLRVAADVSNTTVNFADVTGLTTAVSTGTTYYFECELKLTSAVNTTAPQLSINGPAASAIDYTVLQATTATAVHASGQTAYDTVINAATGPAAVLLPARISGSFVTTASGTFAVRLRSEVAASAVTVKRGSFCLVY